MNLNFYALFNKKLRLITHISACIAAVACLAKPITVLAQKDVLTQHNDLYRTGWYKQETILNTKNVKRGSFGKIFSRAVDDQIYAQPLVKLNLTLPNVGKKNVVFIATVNNSVYAFDADSANVSAPYWQLNLTPNGSRVIANTDMTGACGGGYRDFSGNIGIVSTPVIDSATNTMYLLARSVIKTSGVYEQYIHALDITTGAERPNSPQLVTAQINSNGDGNVNGKLSFDPQKENQRCGILLLNGIIYFAWASHCDWGPYHGWIMGYDKNTLAQKSVYNTTPQGYNGGIWMSGAAPAADEDGNLYVSVGNGSVGVGSDYSDVTNRSESAIKLKPENSTLTVKSFFTPNNIDELEQSDLDFGVTEIMLIPGTTMAMTACKDGKVYVLDRDNMGGYHADANRPLQTIDLGVNAHLRSSFSYYKGEKKEYAYSWSENGLLKAFPLDKANKKFDLANTISSGAQGPTGNSGAFLSVSSNGSVDSTAVLWTTYAANGDANQSVRPGILRAFDATDVTRELWNSSAYQEDIVGNYAKFNCPTIVNGKVYLATFSNKLNVYGLTKNTLDTCNSPNIALNKKGVVSSDEGIPETTVEKAFDGDLNTRWASGGIDGEYIYVDLGARYDLCRVVLRWEAAIGKAFDILVSDDAKSWVEIKSITNNEDYDDYIALKGTGRYVRVNMIERGSPYAYSLYEFEVYGTKSNGDCAAPTGLDKGNIYENSAVLKWAATSAASYNLQYKSVAATEWTTVTASTNTVTIQGLSCATDYLFRVQTNCTAGGTSAYSPVASFSTQKCTTVCGALPTRWTTQDIGDVGIAGSACYNNETFELNGSGRNKSLTADALHFAYKTLVGDGEVKARVITTDQSGAVAGIMIRESMAPGAKYAFIGLSDNSALFQYRLSADAASVTATNANISAPYWIRLVKVKSLYTAYISTNGVNWVAVGKPTELGFGADVPVYVGLSITSYSNTVLSKATVDNYMFSGIMELELKSFTASLTLNKTVALEWVTTLESNISSFVIERSDDNLHYTDVATVDAVNKGKFVNTYTHEVTNPKKGINYFRLRIVSQDGKTSYSAPVYVSVNDSPAPSLYPNPAREKISIAQGTDPIRFIKIFDISGALIKTLNNEASNNPVITVYGLATGVYVVEIRTATAVFRKKFVIVN
ncbi:Por secretion system C-terminal sorting domain-containing protein [Mucilaginibacter pineti]|uniref:Por secretion system C-terminal sorting domain-containing protein n=1 Tax=Mucilaginibacter pineti TaxID=1391627 RepID=A0A1G6X7R4_9SPHI|nr:discoidin domain-containing protein [Mucilaginibacter pineti]SDD73336.1 Por secretion system C-terminal sorting domain-containing protein [Mucilaginibacter pineti]